MPTLVIVDDHTLFRVEARQLLESQGITVIGEAVDGESALLLAARSHPDVVLLDIGLPDIDGFTVAERLFAAQPAICVILTSSRDGSIYGRRIAEAPVAGFLRKDDLSGDAIRELMLG
jgi:two-component system, NarL family, nitrate/nitrite response regulator NarL